MKTLLTVTSIFEGLTGLTLAIAPSVIIPVLLGSAIADPGMLLIYRLAGGALIMLAVACWLARSNARAPVMVKLITAYNILASVCLIGVAVQGDMHNPGLWAAVLIHLVLLVWCFVSLRASAHAGS